MEAVVLRAVRVQMSCNKFCPSTKFVEYAIHGSIEIVVYLPFSEDC